MARIRTVKPEFWTDEKTGPMSGQAKCLFLGLLNLADDYGVVEYRPGEWKVKIFPYDSNTTPVVVEKILGDELLPSSAVEVFSYVYPDATPPLRFLFIRNFCKHQVVNKPSKPLLADWKKGDTPVTYADRMGITYQKLLVPEPSGSGTVAPTLPYGSTPAATTEHSGSTTTPLLPGRERKGKEGNGGGESRARARPPICQHETSPPPSKQLIDVEGSAESTSNTTVATTVESYEDVDDAEFDFGKGLGLTHAEINREIGAFTAHYEANGERRRDWPAAFRKWLVKSVEFRQRDAQRKGG